MEKLKKQSQYQASVVAACIDSPRKDFRQISSRTPVKMCIGRKSMTARDSCLVFYPRCVRCREQLAYFVSYNLTAVCNCIPKL